MRFKTQDASLNAADDFCTAHVTCLLRGILSRAYDQQGPDVFGNVEAEEACEPEDCEDEGGGEEEFRVVEEWERWR